MKILIINGSPRKGNTKCALALLEKAIHEKYNHTDCEYIDVPALKIQGCMHCDGCKKNGGDCVMKDGSAELMNKMMEANVLIFGTPVYWWGISSQLKAYIDKFYSKDLLIQEIASKKVGVIAIGALDTKNIQYKLIASQFESICEYLKWDMMFCSSFSYEGKQDLANDADIEKKIAILAEKI